MGSFERAVILADSGLAVALDKFGSTSTQYRISATNKAYALSAMGYTDQAVEIWKNLLESVSQEGKPTAFQVETLVGLSKVYIRQAQYDSAEYYLDFARYVFISVPEKNPVHADTASVALSDVFVQMNGLQASLYHQLGLTSKATRLLVNQVSMLEEMYPGLYSQLPNYRLSLSNLSVYYTELDMLDSALYFSRKFLEIIPSTDIYNLAQAYQNLGSLFRAEDRLDSALFYWDRALDAIEPSGLKGTYLHNAILNNLGELYLYIEDYQASEGFLEQSLENQNAITSKNPPLFKATLFNLAEVYRWNGKYEPADSIYTLLMIRLKDDLLHNFSHLSENERLSYLRAHREYIEGYQSFALEVSNLLPLQGTDNPYINENIAGNLFDLQLATKGVILDSGGKMRSRILSSNDSTLIRIFRLWESRKVKLGQLLQQGDGDAKVIENLSQKVEENEKWLANRSLEFRQGFVKSEVRWQQVQSRLQEGEAVIELIRLADGLIYGVLILTQQTTQQPMFTLTMSTRSRHLEKEFYNYYYNSVVFRVSDTLSYNTYWQPIKEALRSDSAQIPSTIYVSNDGIYNQINLETIFDPELGKYNLELFELVVLSSSRDLLKGPEVAPKTQSVLLGNPTFSNQNTVIPALPGTLAEVRQVGRSLQENGWEVYTYTGEEATKENLKKHTNPGIVHLATHGYFDESSTNKNDVVVSMIASGLVFASEPGFNDILTSNEVTTLNLDSTYLVVLSACETGKGKINYGDGVYGLQRGFQAAGADHVVMSLWKVDDTATQQLMADFYQRWQSGVPVKAAFRASKLHLMQDHKEPYYWGAFIWSGR